MASVSASRHIFFNSTILHCTHRMAVLVTKIFAAFALMVSLQIPAQAQAVTWTKTDVGSPGVAGTYAYSSGTYTIGGAGGGVADTSDNFTYVSTPTSGNIEIVAKVASQTNTDNYANAGLMIRSNLTDGSATAMVGVTPANGVNFTYRTSQGQTASMTLGPSITAPLYLRLVRSQNMIAGYQSSDGISWSLVGDCNMSLPGQYFAGFAVTSAVPGTLSTAVFTNQNFMVNVPQRGANLAAWYRADAGVVYSGTKVSQLLDQSGNGNNANQSTSSKQPTLITNALNGLPAVGFNGSSQFLQIGSGMANFDAGASVFIVTRPTTITNNARFFDFGNGATNNNLYMSEGTTNKANLFVYSGSTASSLSATAALTAGSYQLLEAVHTGAGNATIFTNGTQKATGAINNITNVTRSGNFLGTDFAKSLFYNGQLAEVLIYNAPLSSAQRINLESYFLSKYGIGSAKTLSSPVINPGTGVYSSTTSVSISAEPGSAIFYTTDGSIPTTASTLYSGPFNVSTSTTVQAIAWQTPQFGGTSSVASATIQIDSTTGSVPRTGMQLWLRSDTGVSKSGTKVSQWLDLSGLHNDAVQATTSKQPTFTASAINGQPSVTFNGSSTYLQCPSGAFSNFPFGASVYIVTKPTTIANSLRFFDFGLGTDTNNNFGAQVAAPNLAGIYVYNGASGNNVLGSGALNTSSYQVFEAIHSGFGAASVFTNGNLINAGPINNINSVTRTTNYIGVDNLLSASGAYFNGNIAEILIYAGGADEDSRKNVEGYLFARYGIKVAAPRYNIKSGVYTDHQLVTITADPGASIYYTMDGSTPTTSSTPYTVPIDVTTGANINAIAVQSFGTSAVSTLYVQIDATANDLPRSGLNLWLKSDTGIFVNGGTSKVTQWTDMSGNNNHAVQATDANRPSLAAGAVNGQQAVTFSGSSQYLQMPAGFADLTAGASAFVVTKPAAVVNTARLFDFGNSPGASNNLYLMQSSSPASSFSMFAYNGSISSSINSGASKLTSGSFQIAEAIHNGAGSASLFTNTLLDSSGAVNNLLNVSRVSNFIGIDSAKTASTSFNGQIAEILVYNRGLSSGEREQVEAYLHTKFAIGNAPALDAPTSNVATGTYTTPQFVQLGQSLNKPVYYTTDGTTPTTSSAQYVVGDPIKVFATTTIKAMSAAPNFANSPIMTVTITIDTQTANIPTANLISWFKADYGVTTSGSAVTQWAQYAGVGYAGTQSTATRQPTLVPNSINGYPSVNFDGTNDFLQLQAGMADFTAGASIFVVANPSSIVQAKRIIDFGQGTASNNNLTFNEYALSGNRMQLVVYNGSTGSGTLGSSGLTANVFQVLEAVHSGAATASLYTNGALTGNSAINNINNITRAVNIIGAANTGTDCFAGKIAEILIYNRALTGTERASVEQYLMNKYSVQSVAAPTITPSNQVFTTAPQTVTIIRPTGSQVYYTTDGSTPTTASTLYTVPFDVSTSTVIKAVASFGTTTSAVTTSYIQFDTTTSAVPRSNLAIWLKADYGVANNSGSVTDWTDMSGSGNTASQTVAAKQPALVSNAVNGLPTVSFDGSADFLQSPSGLADFTQGLSAFVVAKPSSVVNNARFFDFGNGATNNNVYLSESSPNSISLYTYNGTGASSLTAPNAVTSGQYQLVEAMADGAGGATLLTNGSVKGAGLVNKLVNVTRSGNMIATNFAKSLFYGGEIAEVIIYNSALSAQQRANVESYLTNKYAIASTQPVFSPSTGVYFAGQTVTVSAQAGAAIYYTTDGSTPTTASTLYTAPVMVDESTTLKAIAVQPFGTSDVATAYLQIEPNSQGVPKGGLSLWLKSDFGVQTTGSSPFNYLSKWIDMSGSGNDATPNTNAPYLSSGAVANGYPAVFSYDTQAPPPNVGTLKLPIGFNNFDNGANIFIVTKSVNSSVPTAMLDLGNGAGSDNIRLGNTVAATSASFNLYKGATNNVLRAVNGLPSGVFKLIEAQQSGTTGYVQGNDVIASGSLPAANHVTRAQNNVFTNFDGSSNYLGAIAEILVYEKALSSSERANLLAYLNAKYQFAQIDVPSAPIISVPTSTLPAPNQVAIASEIGTKIYYTTDGTTPSTSSTEYVGPVDIIYTTTLKAIAVRDEGGLTSPVSTATYTLDSNLWPAPGPGGPDLQFNLELPTTVP